MSNTAALMGMNLGEARRREARARERGKRFEVDPEVREYRARLLAEREAVRDQQQAKATAEREASPDALRAVLSRGTVDELAEIARMIPRFDGRRMQGLVNDVFRTKSRGGYVPDHEAPQEAQEASQAAKASSSIRTR